MKRFLAVAALTAAIPAAAAAPAGASYTGSMNPDTHVVFLQGDGASDKLKIFRTAGGEVLFDVGDNGTNDDLNGDGLAERFNLLDIARFRVDAGGGNDEILVSEANGAMPGAAITGGPGDDILTTGSAGDSVEGGEDDDVIITKGGVDSVAGGAGDDQLTTGPGADAAGGDGGNDTFTWNPGDGSDDIEGAADRDRQIINGGSDGETFHFSRNGTRSLLQRLEPAPFTIDAGSVEAATLHANGGADTIVGHTGLKGFLDLEIEGGTGDDHISGGDGDERYLWKPGDTVTQEDVDGFEGNDVLALTGDNSSENYEATNDFVRRNGSQPTRTLRIDAIEINGNRGDDLVQATDSLTARPLHLDLGDGNDTAFGGGAGDRIAGGPGDDAAFGRGGDDVLAGGAGIDVLNGGAGADALSCGGFGDQLITDAADTIADDCREPALPADAAPADQPQAPAAEQPAAQPATQPALPAGFRGFARPRVRGTLKTLSVTITNTHSAPITVKVGATESRSRYRGTTRTIAPGAKMTVKLKTPRKLRAALARKLARSGKVVRKPRVSVANVATAGKSALTARVVLRRR